MTIGDNSGQPQPEAEVSGGQGVQVGDHNTQHNQYIQTYVDRRRVATETVPGSVVIGEVPQRPRAFQPRPDLIVALDRRGPGVTVVRALTGMRGVGKTQVAAAYARSCIDAGWRLVAWISADSNSQILDGLAQVAVALQIESRARNWKPSLPRSGTTSKPVENAP